MSNVIDSLPPDLQDVLTTVLDEHDSDLLNSLRASEPSQDEPRPWKTSAPMPSANTSVTTESRPSVDASSTTRWQVPPPLAHRRLGVQPTGLASAG